MLPLHTDVLYGEKPVLMGWGGRGQLPPPIQGRADLSPSMPADHPGLTSYVVRVVSTNYKQYAMVFFKKVSQNKEYFKITLYGGSSPITSGTGS